MTSKYQTPPTICWKHDVTFKRGLRQFSKDQTLLNSNKMPEHYLSRNHSFVQFMIFMLNPLEPQKHQKQRLEAKESYSIKQQMVAVIVHICTTCEQPAVDGQ